MQLWACLIFLALTKFPVSHFPWRLLSLCQLLPFSPNSLRAPFLPFKISPVPNSLPKFPFLSLWYAKFSWGLVTWENVTSHSYINLFTSYDAIMFLRIWKTEDKTGRDANKVWNVPLIGGSKGGTPTQWPKVGCSDKTALVATLLSR